LLISLTLAFSNFPLPDTPVALFFCYLCKTFFFSESSSSSSFTLASLFALLTLVIGGQLIEIKVQIVDFIQAEGIFFAINGLSEAPMTVSLHPLALVLLFAFLKVLVV